MHSIESPLPSGNTTTFRDNPWRNQSVETELDEHPERLQYLIDQKANALRYDEPAVGAEHIGRATEIIDHFRQVHAGETYWHRSAAKGAWQLDGTVYLTAYVEGPGLHPVAGASTVYHPTALLYGYRGDIYRVDGERQLHLALQRLRDAGYAHDEHETAENFSLHMLESAISATKNSPNM